MIAQNYLPSIIYVYDVSCMKEAGRITTQDLALDDSEWLHALQCSDSGRVLHVAVGPDNYTVTSVRTYQVSIETYK